MQTLTREQRRYQERVTQEAQQTLSILSKKLIDALMLDDDPNSDSFKELIKVTSSKWKVYASRTKLNVESYSAIDKFGNSLISQYNEIKEGKEVVG